jgi:hypothetical protein
MPSCRRDASTRAGGGGSRVRWGGVANTVSILPLAATLIGSAEVTAVQSSLRSWGTGYEA